MRTVDGPSRGKEWNKSVAGATNGAMEVARALRMATLGAVLMGLASAARMVEKENVAKAAWKASEQVRVGQERREWISKEHRRRTKW